jgi:hypothetical protein
MKNLYPLRGVNNKDDISNSSPEPLGKISVNDISAFNDESMMENMATPLGLFGKNNGGALDEMDGDYGNNGDNGAGAIKTRFKEEEDKVDLLKGFREGQKKIIIPKIVKGKKQEG